MLTQTLRSLERDGIVTRTTVPNVRVQFEYELTSLGRSWRELVCTIRDWSEAHIEQVHDARAAYHDACGLIRSRVRFRARSAIRNQRAGPPRPPAGRSGLL